MTTESSTSSEEQLTPAERLQLDAACDAFEDQWRSHQWPQLEDFLNVYQEPFQSLLLKELLRIEAFWRAKATDPKRLRDDFLARFPNRQRTVDGVLGVASQTSNESRLQSDSLGPFRQLEKIGDGGFGIVFRAWDTRHQRPVALKIPRFGHQLTGHELEQFLREAKAAGSLDHPSIARVWDSGTTAGVTYIAYQLVEGENLKTRFAEFAKRSPLQIAEFVRQLANAVQYAHERGIIHRDIKPSNVLLTADDRPILTDFGLALATGGDATRSLAGRIGTLDYMSPEQAVGAQDEVDERTDLWSLGVVLYELLTGELPFQGVTDIQLCSNICDAPYKRPRLLRREIPRDLEVIVDRCLQKRTGDRLASCGQLAEELERIESGRPIRSRRVSFVERAIRWCQRNPRPLVAFLMILLATVFGSWSWGLRLSENRQNENVVQQLQLQLEVKNIERRELLSELMGTEPAKIQLLERDIDFLIGKLLASTDLQERLFCAEVLARNEALRPNRFEGNEPRRVSMAAILEELVAGNLDAELRTLLQAALNELTPVKEE